MTNPTFDMQAAIQALRDGKDLSGKDGILTPLIKQLTEPHKKYYLFVRQLPTTQNTSLICATVANLTKNSYYLCTNRRMNYVEVYLSIPAIK